MHLVQCIVIGVMVLVLAIFRRRQFADKHYVKYWTVACVIWFAYYLLLATGHLTGSSFGSESKLAVLDVCFNFANSTVILLSALSIPGNRSIRVAKFVTFVGAVVLLVLGFAWVSAPILAFFGSKLSVFPLMTVVAGYFGAFVLLLFYERFCGAAIGWRPTVRRIAGWSFLGYALLQTAYPYLFHPNPSVLPQWLLYGSAMVFKIACTLLIYLI